MTNKWCAMIAPVMVTGAFVFSGAPATHAAPMATPHHQMPDYRGITRRDDGTGPIVLDFEA